jgi:hypothetical protein
MDMRLNVYYYFFKKVKTSLHQAVGRKKSQPRGPTLSNHVRTHAPRASFLASVPSRPSLSPFAADGDTEDGARGSAGLGNGIPPVSSPADTAPAR